MTDVLASSGTLSGTHRSAPEETPRTPSKPLLGLSLPAPLAGIRERLDLGHLIVAVVSAGALASVGLWWNTAITVAGTAGWLTHAGRITGLLAGYLMAIVVLSMARIPILDRRIGPDRIARWHAQMGRYSLTLMVLHILLITMGSSAMGNVTGYQELMSMIADPDIFDALIGAVILVIVGFVSATAMRIHLPYEVWHALHLFTYLGVYFAFWHQIAAGSEFEENPLARQLWIALYILAGAVPLWYRVIMPIKLNLTHQFRIAGVAWESPNVLSIMISGRDLARLNAQPGQFFRWRFLVGGMWWSANPYSLSAAPRDNLLRITVRTVGDHSTGLGRLRKGDRVLAEGPYGALTVHRRRRRKVLLLAGGVGITPLRALFESLPGGPGDLSLIYRAHNREDLTLWGELKDIATHRQANIWYIVNHVDGSRPTDTAEVLRQRLPDLVNHDVYICGPPGLMSEWHAMSRAAGVPERQIHHESFEF